MLRGEEIDWFEVRGAQGMPIPQSVVCGVDEAGRGPLAGPVSAAVVVLPEDFKHTLVIDSKKLTEAKRSLAYEVVLKHALSYCIVFVSASGIDRLNIREASREAMAWAARTLEECLAAQGLAPRFRYLVDGNVKMPGDFSQETIIKGDQLIPAISAASILAKVSRDKHMLHLDGVFPGYDFAIHKGYPTKLHKERIRLLGPCPIHRRTFSGVSEFLP
jgi:ribonuclease HII